MDPSFQYIFAIVAVLCAIVGLYKRPRHLPLPPGPNPLPILKNVLDMPSTYQWRTFDKWFKDYGDICYVEALGFKFILLGSLQRTSDIFDKRGAYYSDRMFLPMLKLMGFGGWLITGQRYGPWWRAHRRTFEEHFRASAVTRYQGVQLQVVRGLLKRLLDTPDNFAHHIGHTIGAIILRVVYGYQPKDSDDPFIEIAEEAIENATVAGNPGAFLVDLIPWLKYVPSWFPGAGFQRKAAHCRLVVSTMLDRPWKYVKDGLLDGSATPSIAAVLLRELPDGDARVNKEEIAKNCAGTAFSAGFDTTAAASQTFILAMAMFPEAQKKAQAEIDAVIGHERLPNFSDYDSLPYINAVVKETLRWQPVVPVGIPHYSVKDDEYDGYFFPKNTLIVGNVWSILHDPVTYPEPEDFRPERFLKDGKPNPDVKDPQAAFGYGRRVCPGQYIATRSLWAIVCSVLSTFDIAPPLDKSGKPVQLQANMTNGLISYPCPFECIITPRSGAAAALIRDSVDNST